MELPVPMAVTIEAGVERQPSQAVRPNHRGKRKESQLYYSDTLLIHIHHLDIASLSPPVRLSQTRFPQSPQGCPYQ